MKGSLRQRSPGSWELTIDTGRDALGKRQRKFLTVRGTKAQAQRRLRELLSNIDRGIPPIPDKTLLRDWLDRWMDEVIAPNRRQGTKERYRDIIDRYINPYIGHIPLVNVGPAQIQALETELSRRLSPKGVGQVPYRPVRRHEARSPAGTGPTQLRISGVAAGGPATGNPASRHSGRPRRA